MDDFEKKELDGNEAAHDTTPDTAVDENSADSLAKELEEIRDMFQEALDNAALQESAVEGELIQELDDITPEHSEEAVELPLCDCCGENPVSTAYGEDYPYCEDCRELMKRYPLRLSGIVSIVAMIVIFGLSVYFGMDSFENALVVLDAHTHASSGKMMSAVQSLYTFTNNQETDSKKAVRILIDGFMRTGYINNAKEVIEKYYTEEELNRSSNKEYKEIVDFVDNFLATRDAVQTIVNGAFSGEDFDCDKLIQKLDAEKEKFTDEQAGIKYNAPLIEYYKYELLRLSGAEPEKQLEVLLGIEKADEKGLAEWIYVPSLCEVASKTGNKELAEKYFEKMKKNNAEDMKAYTSFALYYRYLENPDADAIIALCNEAAGNAYQGDISYYPTLAVAYLIKGEGALAFDTMTQYMSSNYYTVSNCNLYALCALYCGDTATYENMEATLKSSGFEISDLVKKYKADKLSVDEVLADMRGDIG